MNLHFEEFLSIFLGTWPFSGHSWKVSKAGAGKSKWKRNLADWKRGKRSYGSMGEAVSKPMIKTFFVHKANFWKKMSYLLFHVMIMPSEKLNVFRMRGHWIGLLLVRAPPSGTNQITILALECRNGKFLPSHSHHGAEGTDRDRHGWLELTFGPIHTGYPQIYLRLALVFSEESM